MRLPLLFLHIAGGMVGVLSGMVAVAYRKGSSGHRMAGNIFVISMLAMGSSASWLAVMKHETGNFFGGLLTVYMVATAWQTAQSKERETSLLDWGAMVFAAVLGGVLMTLAVLVAIGSLPRTPGVPLGMSFFVSTIPLLAAAGDFRMLMRGGISGTARVARHLWRMCFGWFIATGSFFLGKQKLFPEPIRKQYLLVPLAILPLILLIYWMVRVKFSNRESRRMTLAYEQRIEAPQTSHV